MKAKSLLLWLALFSLVVFGIFYWQTPDKKGPLLVSRTDPPKLEVTETLHELGTVKEGSEIPYVFKLNNVGGEPLIIKNVKTSCGCTLLNLKDRVIEPGKTGDLEVIMDTTMKQGYVKKAIHIVSNDPKHHKYTIFLAANVVGGVPKVQAKRPPNKTDKNAAFSEDQDGGPPDPHMGLTQTGRAKIFTGQCATCHVNMGKGKLGGELFQADCAMCHGLQAEGGVGPALVPGSFHDKQYTEHVQQIIRYGSPTHVSMPGFFNEAGGPLTDGEINSIVQYLQNKSDQLKDKPTDLPGG